MKKIQFLVLFLMMILNSCETPALEKSGISFLHTRGQYIVNEQNDTLLLRGVGLGNWLLPEGYMWHFGDEADRPRKIEALITDLTDAEYSDDFWKRFRRDYIREADIKKIKELGFNSVRPALNARCF